MLAAESGAGVRLVCRAADFRANGGERSRYRPSSRAPSLHNDREPLGGSGGVEGQQAP